jgi:hypothetical protein
MELNREQKKMLLDALMSKISQLRTFNEDVSYGANDEALAALVKNYTNEIEKMQELIDFIITN